MLIYAPFAQTLGVDLNARTLDARWIWLVVGCLAAWPFFNTVVPPLMDLPGHMARFHIMRELPASAPLQRYYGFDWTLLGNLGVDLFVYAVRDFLSVEQATWFACLMTVLLRVYAIFRLSKAAHGAVQPTAFLALPFVYSYFFQYGFLNYALSVPLALIALSFWLERTDRPWRNAMVFGLAGLALWLCHTMGWGIFALCAGLSTLQQAHARHGWKFGPVLRTVVQQCWPLALPIILMVVVRGDVPPPARYFSNSFLIDKVRYALQALRDQSLALDIATLAILGGLPALALARGWMKFSPLLMWPAIGFGATYLLMPSSPFYGTLYTDARLFPVAAIVALVALKWTASRKTGSILCVAAITLFGVRTLLTADGWQRADVAAQRHLQALALVPEGARIFSAVALDCDKHVWATDFLLNHLPAFAVLRRDAYMNSMWALPGQQALRVIYNADSPYNADPSQYFTKGTCNSSGPSTALRDMARTFPRHRFDFVWIMDPPPKLPRELARFPKLYEDDRTLLLKVPG